MTFSINTTTINDFLKPYNANFSHSGIVGDTVVGIDTKLHGVAVRAKLRLQSGIITVVAIYALGIPVTGMFRSKVLNQIATELQGKLLFTQTNTAITLSLKQKDFILSSVDAGKENDFAITIVVVL